MIDNEVGITSTLPKLVVTVNVVCGSECRGWPTVEDVAEQGGLCMGPWTMELGEGEASGMLPIPSLGPP